MTWPTSISLKAAHDLFSAVNVTEAGKFSAFVWRAFVYPCVTEPLFIFERGPTQDMVFVGSHAKKACRTSVMVDNPTNRPPCHLDCY